MELARALTKRNKRPDIAVMTPARAASARRRDGPITRDIISPPIELLSTTNVLAYNAPNIYGDDSDSSLGSLASSRGTTPDNSSVECSPSPVEENHLSNFFRSPGLPLSGRGSQRQSNASSEADAPLIPTRALSHTKKSHQAVARKHSVSRTTPSTPALPSPTKARSSIDMFSSKPDADHPFGAELEKVNELAEEIGARDVLILDEEEQYLESNGLCRLGVQDYLNEIHGLFGGSFSNPFGPFTPVWI
ncbi:hypothetical protein G7Y79_00017g043640 [Physcia stellaris]|nr:hypothetical protein G7Y79_00017g043640 [Physcia stellaris]